MHNYHALDPCTMQWSGATMSSQKSVSMVLYPQIQSTADHEDCKKYALEKKICVVSEPTQAQAHVVQESTA